MSTTTKKPRFSRDELEEITLSHRTNFPVYVIRGVNCDLNHGGNRRISADPGDRYGQCMGCHRSYRPNEVRAMKGQP